MSPRTLPLLSFPSVLNPMLISLATTTTPAKGWIQLAKTGSFVSNRYGKFAITRDDLQQMKFNFDNVTPKAPTELPIDYDHLGIDPKHPGDGIAAGWLKELELRAEGEELWGRAEWTPRGASVVRDGEYRFISPSFVKDYVDTHSGKKIGTTLLAAAITNHPFLQGMAALSLYSREAHGHLALSADLVSQLEAPVNRPVLHLGMDGIAVGQRVAFVENSDELVPELTPEERAGTYIIKRVRGQGDDAFVVLESSDGTPFGWYPVAALSPAPASSETPSPLPENTVEVPANTALAVPPEGVATTQPDPRFHTPRNFNDGVPVVLSADEAEQQLIALSYQIAKDQSISLAAATKQAAMLHRDWVDLRNDIAPEPEPEPVVSLSATMAAASSFIDLVHSVKAAHNLTDWREAMSLASAARPDLAQKYREDGI